MLKQELAPRGVGIPVLQGEEEVKLFLFWGLLGLLTVGGIVYELILAL